MVAIYVISLKKNIMDHEREQHPNRSQKDDIFFIDT